MEGAYVSIEKVLEVWMTYIGQVRSILENRFLHMTFSPNFQRSINRTVHLAFFAIDIRVFQDFQNQLT